MKSEKINESLNYIDNDLVCDYVAKRDQLLKKRARRRAFIGSGGLVACACLILCFMLIIQPLIFEKAPPEILNSIVRGDKVTGEQYLSFEIADNSSEDEDSGMSGAGFGFRISTVLNVKVKCVLPDIYFDPYFGKKASRIAVLEVIDTIRGENIPKEIFCMFYDCGKDVFEGYSSFIFSVSQVGMQNYVTVNKTQGCYEFFPHMFKLFNTDNLGFGSVIAFKHGRVDMSFWQKTNDSYFPRIQEFLTRDSSEMSYPATSKSRFSEVVANIKNLMKTLMEGTYRLSDFRPYMQYADFCISDEITSILESFKPNAENVFYQDLNLVVDNRLTLHFTRVINGFRTDEDVYINIYEDGTFEKLENYRHQKYSASDIANAPDIGKVIEGITIENLPQPKNLDDRFNNDDMKSFLIVSEYIKLEGRVYGVININWYYKNEVGRAHHYDYYVYDAEGNLTVMTYDEYRKFLKGTT